MIPGRHDTREVPRKDTFPADSHADKRDGGDRYRGHVPSNLRVGDVGIAQEQGQSDGSARGLRLRSAAELETYGQRRAQGQAQRHPGYEREQQPGTRRSPGFSYRDLPQEGRALEHRGMRERS